MFRLALAVVLFTAYCLLFGILWLNNVPLQLYSLGALTVLGFNRLGAGSMLKQLKLISPFVASLVLIYGLFILFRISPGNASPTAYWLGYGVPRTVLLVGSILAFRLCFSFVSIDQMLNTKLDIRFAKYLILGKILYAAAFNSYSGIRFWQELVPSQSYPARSTKLRFRRSLAAALALVLFTLSEAAQKGEMIDNRIETCFKEIS